MDKKDLIELVIKPIEAKGGKAYFVGGLKPSPLFKKMLRVAYRHQYENNETDKKKDFSISLKI